VNPNWSKVALLSLEGLGVGVEIPPGDEEVPLWVLGSQSQAETVRTQLLRPARSDLAPFPG